MAPEPAKTAHHHAKPKAERTLELPIAVATVVDVGRLLRELDGLDDTLHQLGLRQGGSEVKMPQTSLLLDETAKLNRLNLLHATDRQALKKFLEGIRQNAPVLHMSFSVDPTPAFVEKLMTWLRKEIHHQVLLTIGLQPNIGAGCFVRTDSKFFDLSLRQDFLKKKDLLQAKLAPVEKAAHE